MTAWDDDRIALRVDGMEFAGVGGKRWSSAVVTTSLEELASSFELSALGVFAPAVPFIREGDEVEVWIGQDRVIRGYVDEVEHSGDADREEVKVRGRSRTCDLIDCSAPLGTWRGLRLGQLLRTLMANYPVELVDEADVAAKIIGRHSTEEGESFHDILDRMSREMGFLVTDDGSGNLVLTHAGAGGTARDTIIRGSVGFLSGSVTRRVDERYSSYVIRGQVASDLDVDPSVNADASDLGVRRFRELVVRAERGLSRQDARIRAGWEAVTRAAKSIQANYTVRGWRQRDGTLWRKNQLVEVIDGFAGVIGAELLIIDVTLSISATEGRVTTMRLGPPEGFTPLPPRTKSVTPVKKIDLPSTAPDIEEGT